MTVLPAVVAVPPEPALRCVWGGPVAAAVDAVAMLLHPAGTALTVAVGVAAAVQPAASAAVELRVCRHELALGARDMFAPTMSLEGAAASCVSPGTPTLSLLAPVAADWPAAPGFAPASSAAESLVVAGCAGGARAAVPFRRPGLYSVLARATAARSAQPHRCVAGHQRSAAADLPCLGSVSPAEGARAWVLALPPASCLVQQVLVAGHCAYCVLLMACAGLRCGADAHGRVACDRAGCCRRRPPRTCCSQHRDTVRAARWHSGGSGHCRPCAGRGAASPAGAILASGGRATGAGELAQCRGAGRLQRHGRPDGGRGTRRLAAGRGKRARGVRAALRCGGALHPSCVLALGVVGGRGGA